MNATDDARAEAEGRYSADTALSRMRREAFIDGAEWAAGRAETTTACTCDAAPAEIGGASHRPGCGEAETATATTEGAEEVLHGAGWFARADLDPRDLHGILHDLADAGLLNRKDNM